MSLPSAPSATSHRMVIIRRITEISLSLMMLATILAGIIIVRHSSTAALYVALNNGTVEKISQANGATLWDHHFTASHRGYMARASIISMAQRIVVVAIAEAPAMYMYEPVHPPLNPRWVGLDALTGAQIWSIPSSSDSLNVPFINDTRLISTEIMMNDGMIIRAYDIEAGKQLWSASFASIGSLAHNERYVFLMSCGGFSQVVCTIQALNLSDGAIAWKRATDLQQPLVLGAAGDDVFGRSQDHLIALNAQTGERLWEDDSIDIKQPADNLVPAAIPVIIGANAISIAQTCTASILGKCKTMISARNAITGALRWQVTDPTVDDILQIVQDTVFFFDYTEGEHVQKIVALDGQNGIKQWELQLAGDGSNQADGINLGTIGGIDFTTQSMLIGSDTSIYAFDPRSGMMRWHHALSPAMPSVAPEYKPIWGFRVNQRGVIFAINQNRLVALNEQTGDIMWQRTVSGLDSGPLFLDDAAEQ